MKRIVLLLLALALVGPAHELVDNRATLVLREFAAFLLIYSSMDAAQFEKELARAQKRFQAQIHVFAPEKEAALSGWVWPDAKTVQAMLRERVMRTMVDPNVHAHEAPVELRAEAVAAQEITGARVQFPAEWQRMLVVWYRPSQQWAEGGTVSPVLRF